MKKNILIFVVVVFAISSCKKEEVAQITQTTQTVQNANFPFLAVGNKWTYDYTQFYTSGKLINEILSVSSGKYKISMIIDNNIPIYQYWFADGAYLKTIADGETTSKSIYKDNPFLNDKWSNPGSTGNTIYYKVVKLQDTVTTSTGVFYDCVKIEVTFSNAVNTQYNYWSKKYGQVFQTGLASLDLTAKNF